ncbi:MAG: F0F1 ATP synthase subunit alpha, partial [Acutalibacteraceae bacterium]
VEILKQDKNSLMPVELQVAVIFATVNGYLKNSELKDVKRYEKELCEFLQNKYDELLDDIKSTGNLSDESTALLEKAVGEFTDKFYD